MAVNTVGGKPLVVELSKADAGVSAAPLVANEQEPIGSAKIQKIVYSCRIDHAGTIIKVLGWKVENSTRPPIVIAHDVGESIERYEALARAFASEGYSVYGFSMRGHDGGLRLGSIPSFSLLVNDLLQVLAWAKHNEEGRKPVVFARGMGALLALSLTRGHGKFLQALIFVSPMFNLNYNLTPFRRFLIRTIADVAPRLRLPRWLSPTFTNSGQETYVYTDKKRNPKLNSHFTFELLNSVAQSKKLLKKMHMPSLIVCPLADPALRYEFLKPLAHKHKYAGQFTIKFVEGEDNLPLAEGGNTFRYVTQTVLKWLAEYPERIIAHDQSSEGFAVEQVSNLTSENPVELTSRSPT
jgi:alpha-beta hydrolase superfamily lysophospholipase